MKPAHKLGFKFRFLYHIIYAASSLSRGEERKKVSARAYLMTVNGRVSNDATIANR